MHKAWKQLHVVTDFFECILFNMAQSDPFSPGRHVQKQEQMEFQKTFFKDFEGLCRTDQSS